MKKYELLTLVGKTMERIGMNYRLIEGLGLNYTMTMIDTMNTDIVKDEKETISLINGLMSDNPKYVNYWIGVAIKTLAMSSK
jgi:hypothetical protein|nr:MAG TPA: hypothetical protein [Caudoviricetes sp.]